MILDSSMLHVRLGFVRLLPRAFWLLTLLLVVSSCAIMPFSNVVSGMLVAGYYDLGDGVGVIGLLVAAQWRTATVWWSHDWRHHHQQHL